MKTATLSTIISAPVKKAVSEYCKRNGLKIRYFIEEALIERLEDAMDIEAYKQRKNEPTIPFEEVVKNLK